jgi:hypothetical protein
MTFSSPSHHSLHSLDKVITPLITPVIRRRGLAQAAILLEWEKIVREMAHVCLPIRLRFPRGKKCEGTLYLWVDSGAALRLEYAKDMIISCVNSYFGYRAVSSLKFYQTSLKQVLNVQKQRLSPTQQARSPASITSPPPSIKRQTFCSLDDIPSEKLQKTLKSFGEALGYTFMDSASSL